MKFSFVSTNPRVVWFTKKRYDPLKIGWERLLSQVKLDDLKLLIEELEIADPVSGSKKLDRRSPIQPDVLH